MVNGYVEAFTALWIEISRKGVAYIEYDGRGFHSLVD